jgi:hypothetical protein
MTETSSSKTAADFSFEERMVAQESKQNFKERVATGLAEVAERVLTKAISANSENIAAFMANVSEYEVSLDSIEGEFTSPTIVRQTEGPQSENSGNGSFKLNGFKLIMKMRSDKK